MKIKQNLSNYIIIAIFLLMITLPQILFWFFKDYIDLDTSENRTLANPKMESKIEQLNKKKIRGTVMVPLILLFSKYKNIRIYIYKEFEFLLVDIVPNSLDFWRPRIIINLQAY